MRFLLDAGLPGRAALALRELGHDAVPVRDIGLSRAPDVALFQLAREQGRVLVTLDLDFAEIVAFSRGAVVSVVLLRLGQPTAPLIVERLTAVLEAAVPALDKGAIVVVEKSRYRVRHLPIGT